MIIAKQCIESTLSPAEIWERWASVEEWSSWDADVKESGIDGSFKNKTVGWLKPVKGPKVKLLFSNVVPQRSFTTTSRLPMARLIFVHKVAKKGEGSSVQHRVELRGLSAPLFARIIGPGIKRGLPIALELLAGGRRIGEV